MTFPNHYPELASPITLDEALTLGWDFDDDGDRENDRGDDRGDDRQ